MLALRLIRVIFRWSRASVDDFQVSRSLMDLRSLSGSRRRRQRGLTVLAVVGAIAVASACFWWLAQKRSDIRYLPQHDAGEWILYPAPPQPRAQWQIKRRPSFLNRSCSRRNPARLSCGCARSPIVKCTSMARRLSCRTTLKQIGRNHASTDRLVSPPGKQQNQRVGHQ